MEEILFRKVPFFFFFSQDFLSKSLSNIIIIHYFYLCGVFWVGVRLLFMSQG